MFQQFRSAIGVRKLTVELVIRAELTTPSLNEGLKKNDGMIFAFKEYHQFPEKIAPVDLS